MKLLANRKVKSLFGSILLCILVFLVIAVLFASLAVRNNMVYIIICFCLMSATILLLCYRYFREQHEIMESAISQITEYLAGNKDVTIEGND